MKNGVDSFLKRHIYIYSFKSKIEYYFLKLRIKIWIIPIYVDCSIDSLCVHHKKTTWNFLTSFFYCKFNADNTVENRWVPPYARRKTVDQNCMLSCSLGVLMSSAGTNGCNVRVKHRVQSIQIVDRYLHAFYFLDYAWCSQGLVFTRMYLFL